MRQEEIKHMALPFETKGAGKPVVKGRRFSGYSSTPALDLGGDIVEPRAFNRSVIAFRKGALRIPLLDSHNRGSITAVLGKLVDVKVGDDGLWTEWEIVKSPIGDEALARVEGGYVDGLSIGYRVIDAEPLDNDVRRILDLELLEVSLVSFPMNPEARIDRRGQLAPDDPVRKALEARLLVRCGGLARGPLLPSDPRRVALEHQLARMRSHLVRDGHITPTFEL